MRAQAPVFAESALGTACPGRREFTSSKCGENSRVAVPQSEHRLPEPLLTDILGELDGWERQGESITKTFTLKGWKSAMAFANNVADAAATANHHPDIHIEGYNKVRVVLTTHATGGISDADVALAEEIDKAEGA